MPNDESRRRVDASKLKHFFFFDKEPSVYSNAADAERKTQISCAGPSFNTHRQTYISKVLDAPVSQAKTRIRNTKVVQLWVSVICYT